MFEIVLTTSYDMYVGTPNEYNQRNVKPIGAFYTEGDAEEFGRVLVQATKRKLSYRELTVDYVTAVVRKMA